MYQFIRTVTVKSAVDYPVALQFAGEVTAYLNKAHSLNMKFGIETFGTGNIHWHFDTDSLDKISAMNAKLMQDREYTGLLEKHRGLWVEGSLKDTLVRIIG
jgi:hypothetical protein